MSQPGRKSYPKPSSRNTSIEAWISTVSSHPRALTSPMPTPIPVSSDNEGTPASTTRNAATNQSRKQARADSSPLACNTLSCLPQSWEESIPSSPTTSRSSTPADTEAETASAISEGDSNFSAALKNKRQHKTAQKREAGDLETELVLCIARIKDTKALAYATFEDPVLIYEEDLSVMHYGFKCKHCSPVVRCLIGVSTTSGLRGHIQTCPSSTKQTQVLGDFGITRGSTVRLTPEQVRESFALWTAESAQPFCIVKDRHLERLLHPDAHTHQPHCVTISKDIQRIYQATETNIKKVLADHTGVFHTALDLFQSGNGYDEEHTGVELAKTLHAVFVKFKIEDRVWGVVFDNASNNGAMMKELATYGLKRLTRLKARVHCVLHVLNLAAQAVAALSRAKRRAMVNEHGRGDSDEEDEPEESVSVEHNTQEDSDLDDDGLDPSIMLHVDSDEPDAEDDEDTAEIDLPKMVIGSVEEIKQSRAAMVLFKASYLLHRFVLCEG
ncbi:hypothetical protein BDV93DRAFT_563877 [Ceratobasidium sp. AG-I]|nr:hypothetical protein BDV93DRAFT_563877 [Ceratobasidium sp. AG-I]